MLIEPWFDGLDRCLLTFSDQRAHDGLGLSLDHS